MMPTPRGLYVTFAVTSLVAVALAVLLGRPGRSLTPLRNTTFELDEPAPATPASP
jgi:hypothetical protein